MLIKNSPKLYQFLIEEFGFKKIDESTSPQPFGNFYIVLACDEFILNYVNDRSFLSIEIANIMEPDNLFDIAIVKALINEEDNLLKIYKIDELNSFIKLNMDRLKNLFKNNNYLDTKEQLQKLVKKRAEKMFP